MDGGMEGGRENNGLSNARSGRVRPC